MSLSFRRRTNMPVWINNCTYFLCLITSGSESELFCVTPKKGLVEFSFAVCGVCVSPHLCWASFLCIFHDWKDREVIAFCMPITNNSSLHIFLDICVYISTVFTPVGTYFHAYGFV